MTCEQKHIPICERTAAEHNPFSFDIHTPPCWLKCGMIFFSTILALASIIACATAADSPREISPGVAAAEARVVEAKRLAEKEFPLWADKLPEGPASLTPSSPDAVFLFDQTPLVDDAHPERPSIPVASLTEGHQGKALSLSEIPVSVPKLGRFSRHDSFTLAVWLRTTASPSAKITIVQSGGHLSDKSPRGYQLYQENDQLIFALRHSPSESIEAAARANIPHDRWVHIAATYDGSSRASGVQLYIDGLPAPAQTIADKLAHDFIPPGNAGIELGPCTNPGASIDNLRVYPRALAPIEITALAGLEDYTTAVQHIPDLQPAQHTALLEYYIATAHQPSIEAHAMLREARKKAAGE
jgi:hypothetical protein